jgi:hypothetical protein
VGRGIVRVEAYELLDPFHWVVIRQGSLFTFEGGRPDSPWARAIDDFLEPLRQDPRRMSPISLRRSTSSPGCGATDLPRHDPAIELVRKAWPGIPNVVDACHWSTHQGEASFAPASYRCGHE